MLDFDNTITPNDIHLVESIAKNYLGSLDSPPINIPVGSVNKVFRVDIQKQPYIFRLSQDPCKNKVQEYEKERWCAQQAHQAGIHTPLVLEVGIFENTAFMIQSFVEGELCTKETLDKMYIWEALGRSLSKIHAIRTEGYGMDLVDPENNRFSQSWDKWLDHNIHAINPDDPLLELGYVNANEHKSMKECFLSIKAHDWHFGLFHGDVSLRNAILGDNGIVTIIDWGCAGSKIVPFIDFAQIIKSERPTLKEFGAFLFGYGIETQMMPSVQQKINQIALYAATDTLRWAIDHKVVARNRYIASLRWALDLYLGKIEWHAAPYHEEYGLKNLR
ncbi:MAG: aminoglycoside phosphotransferase family protein [Chloroflexota bacterium]